MVCEVLIKALKTRYIISVFLIKLIQMYSYDYHMYFKQILLCVQMPAMCLAGELEENKKQIGTVYIFILQNLGILTGFGIMLVLAIYGGHIEEAITETT